MIDFGKLTRKRATETDDVPDSFVGIKGNVFYVPLGEPVEGEFDEAANRELFLLLYRVLRKSTGRLSACGREKEQSANDRDGAGRGQATRTFTVETDEGEEELIYTRLQGVDDVLDAYDELTLFGLRSRLRQSVEVDFSRIDRHLDRAVFLRDDTIYLDTMTMPREGLERFDTDLVQLYCFLYDDIRAALGERDAVRPEVRAEAEKLRERYLWPAATLFGPGWAETLRELRGLFERIVQFTAYRDDAYWRYHDAVRQTLYPNERGNENGVHWGISNFCFVWEDMGHAWMERLGRYEILYADRMEGEHGQKKEDLQKMLTVSGTGGKEVRLRPDAIVRFSAENSLDSFEFWKHKYKYEKTEETVAIYCKGMWHGHGGKLKVCDHEWGKHCWFGSRVAHSCFDKLTRIGDYGDEFSPNSYAIEKEGARRASSLEQLKNMINGLEWMLNDYEKKPLLMGEYKKRKNEKEYAVINSIPFHHYDKRLGEEEFYLDLLGQKLEKIKMNGQLYLLAMRSWDKADEEYKDYCRVVDFKYKPASSFKAEELDEGARKDIVKQLAYELVLQDEKFAVQNCLVVPIDEKAKETEFLDNWGVWLVPVSLRTLAESYA